MPGFVLHVFLFFGDVPFLVRLCFRHGIGRAGTFFCLYVSLLGKHFVMIVRIIHYFCKINLLNAVSI